MEKESPTLSLSRGKRTNDIQLLKIIRHQELYIKTNTTYDYTSKMAKIKKHDDTKFQQGCAKDSPSYLQQLNS